MRDSASAWNPMKLLFRLIFYLAVLAGSSISGFLVLRAALAQQTGSIAAEHLILFMPSERTSLGRELIADVERCYDFMNRATNGSLPKKVFITVSWDQPESSCNRREASITIGMSQPAAETDARGYLFHSASREIARLGLLELSQGAQREDTEFLFEGMIEILVHEFDHSSRSLEAAWTLSKYLDEMQQLGLGAQRTWSSFSGGKRCLRSAAPGITFLTTFRELQGRERATKLFEALRKNSLLESLNTAFRAPVADLESTWLKRVREYRIPDEITMKADTAPRLLQTVFPVETGKPGTPLQVRLFIENRARNLLPDGVFVRDSRTGRLLQAQSAAEKSAAFLIATIPIEANCPPGQYPYEVTAIDESGNLRRWNSAYTVR